MLETFANESETANIERLVTAAFSAQRQRPDKGRVKDIEHITFHTHRQDEILAYFASPTAHTTWIFLEENGLS